MKLVQPNSNVTPSKKTPQRFLRRACEISRKGRGQPVFYNTEAQIMELINAGKTLKMLVVGSSGCVETEHGEVKHISQVIFLGYSRTLFNGI